MNCRICGIKLELCDNCKKELTVENFRRLRLPDETHKHICVECLSDYIDCSVCYHYQDMSGVYQERSFCKIGKKRTTCDSFLNRKDRIGVLKFKMEQELLRVDASMKNIGSAIRWIRNILEEL